MGLRKVEFYRHPLTRDDASSIAEVLDTLFLTSGNVCRTVEAQLCRYFGSAHASLVNSWTNGAHAALLALGIRPGDEVIIPAMTFVATANIIELVGAKPIFVDVDSDTLLMTIDATLAAVTDRTKAIIPVHLYGQMVDVKALRDALKYRPDIAILEDCAHCFEGERDGEKPGLYSTAAIFSFYATKNITCGEGGAVITNDGDFYRRFLESRLHGMSAEAVDRYHQTTYRHWDMARLGTKANLPDLLAALLPKQIAGIDRSLNLREAVASRYESGLAGLPFRRPSHLQCCRHAQHLFVIHVPPALRDNVLDVLGENGIGSAVNFRSVPTMMYYRDKYGFGPDDFPISYEWGAGVVSLPFYPTLSHEDQDHVIHVLREQVAPMIEANIEYQSVR